MIETWNSQQIKKYHLRRETVFSNGCRCSMRMVPSRPTRCVTLLKAMLLLAMFFAPEFAAAGGGDPELTLPASHWEIASHPGVLPRQVHCHINPQHHRYSSACRSAALASATVTCMCPHRPQAQLSIHAPHTKSCPSPHPSSCSPSPSRAACLRACALAEHSRI